MKPKIYISFLLSLTFNTLFGLSGKEVLDKVETSLTGFKDQSATAEVILGKIEGSVEEKRIMKLWSAGKNRRVVKFVSPASVKNIGILVNSSDEMYIYLPAYGKVRRIQGSMRDRNFQGTDFSYREIGSFEYSDDYESKVTKEDENIITLELSRKEKSDAPYTKIVMLVEKKNFLPEKLEMYTEKQLKKVLKILSKEKRKDYWILTHIRMEDLSQKHYTEIKMNDIIFDTNLEEKGIFSTRFLQEPVE